MSNDFEDDLDLDGIAEDGGEMFAEDDTSAVGTTSAQTEVSEFVDDGGKKKRNLAFSVFDAMLLLSLVFVSLAVMMLIWELSGFGSISSLPWNTN